MGHSHSKSRPSSPNPGTKPLPTDEAPPTYYDASGMALDIKFPTPSVTGSPGLERHASLSEDALDMLRKYDVIVLVDDSGSMTENNYKSWRQARDALSALADKAGRYDVDGIDVCFLNSSKKGKRMHDAASVLELFDKVRPNSGTPIGDRLEYLLNKIIEEAETRKTKGTLKDLKPTSIIVITDGEATDDPESVIVAAARRLDANNLPLNQVGIQFVQVGDDVRATEFLRELDDNLTHTHQIRDIVDTTPSSSLGGALNADSLIKILLGGINRRHDKKPAPIAVP